MDGTLERFGVDGARFYWKLYFWLEEEVIKFRNVGQLIIFKNWRIDGAFYPIQNFEMELLSLNGDSEKSVNETKNITIKLPFPLHLRPFCSHCPYLSLPKTIFIGQFCKTNIFRAKILLPQVFSSFIELDLRNDKNWKKGT